MHANPARRRSLLLLLGLCTATAALAVEPAAPGADPSFEEIVSSATPANRPGSCERMQAWVDHHAGHPLAPRGLLWMAQLRRAGREPLLARPLLERLLRDFPPGEWSLHARQGLAELDLEDHHYQAAIARFRGLSAEPQPLWQFLGNAGVKRAQGERLRFFLALGFLGAAAALSLWRLRRSGGPRTLWPPPDEVVYLGPVLLLVALAASAQEHDEAAAVLTLALGLFALLWLNGAWSRFRAGGPGKARRALLGGLQAGGLLYCALVFNHLWAKLIDTIAMGAE